MTELNVAFQVMSKSNVIREYLFIIEPKENFSEKYIYRMWTRLTTTLLGKFNLVFNLVFQFGLSLWGTFCRLL